MLNYFGAFYFREFKQHRSNNFKSSANIKHILAPFVLCGQGSSLLWTPVLRPYYSHPYILQLYFARKIREIKGTRTLKVLVLVSTAVQSLQVLTCVRLDQTATDYDVQWPWTTAATHLLQPFLQLLSQSHQGLQCNAMQHSPYKKIKCAQSNIYFTYHTHVHTVTLHQYNGYLPGERSLASFSLDFWVTSHALRA